MTAHGDGVAAVRDVPDGGCQPGEPATFAKSGRVRWNVF
jgi:hypothetical protein